jgi:AcrR family transcriptional regulator
MADGPLTEDAILAATEDVLRRYGPAKATVVDVARALGVSHGSVYRHFPSKAELRAAVTRRWMTRAHHELHRIATSDAPACERLRAWLAALFATKRDKARDDPELFATYAVLVGAHIAVPEYLDDLLAQIASIVAAGMETGEFAAVDPAAAARAVFDATTLFHHPAHVAEWSAPGVDTALAAVTDLVLVGLTGR